MDCVSSGEVGSWHHCATFWWTFRSVFHSNFFCYILLTWKLSATSIGSVCVRMMFNWAIALDCWRAKVRSMGILFGKTSNTFCHEKAVSGAWFPILEKFSSSFHVLPWTILFFWMCNSAYSCQYSSRIMEKLNSCSLSSFLYTKANSKIIPDILR